MFQNWVCYLHWILIENIPQGEEFPSISSLVSTSVLCDLCITLLAVDKNSDHQTKSPGSSKDQACGLLKS